MESCCLCGKSESENTKTDFIRKVIFDEENKKITSNRIFGIRDVEYNKLSQGENTICYNRTNCKQRQSKRISTCRSNNGKIFSKVKNIINLRDNNAKALYNGYIGGLSVEWMSSMANISESYAYHEIRRIRKQNIISKI